MKFFFKAPYAPWKGLFGSGYPLMPAHALQGEDFNKVFAKNLNNPKNGKPISDGPYTFGKWVQDQTLILNRDPHYWGWSPTGKLHQATIDKIIFKFVTDTNSEIQCEKSGECDMIYPQPQLALADLKGQSGLGIQSSAGPMPSTPTGRWRTTSPTSVTTRARTSTRSGSPAGSGTSPPTAATDPAAGSAGRGQPGSDRGRPNQGRTLLSKRVTAQTRWPVRVKTKRPAPWRMPPPGVRR